MTLIFYIIIGIITFIAFLNAWASKEFEINRTIIINRQKDEVFKFVRQLKKEHLWKPWFKNEINGNFKYNGEDGKPDALLYWKGHSPFYEGIEKITKIHQGKIIESHLILVKPFRMVLIEYKGLKEIDENKTKIVWGLKGGLAFPFTVFALIYPVEKAYAEKLEEGLKNLKTLLENKHEKTGQKQIPVEK